MNHYSKKDMGLFLTASIRSHVVPSLYLKGLLSAKYEIVYAVTNELLAELVTENCYRAIINSGWRVGYQMEGRYLAAQKQQPTYFRLLKSYRTDELYHARKKELGSVVDELRPVAIFIDLFVCTEFWILNDRRNEAKLLFFNTILSTYQAPGYPTVSEGYWNRGGFEISTPTSQKTKSLKLSDWFRLPKATLMQRAIHSQTQPALPRPVPNRGRQFTELDETFVRQWPELLENRQPGEKWIYCSFGTFHEGADATLLRFVTNLLEVVREWPTVRLLCSVNKYLIETLRARNHIPLNTHFFSRVLQLQVLAEANVLITHGGFGSIEESICCGVPMLVYPLDPKYDQNSNTLKVVHYGLGLRGLFTQKRIGDLRKKVTELLNNETYRNKVRGFRATIRKQYPEEKLKEEVSHLIAGERYKEFIKNPNLAAA